MNTAPFLALFTKSRNWFEVDELVTIVVALLTVVMQFTVLQAFFESLYQYRTGWTYCRIGHVASADRYHEKEKFEHEENSGSTLAKYYPWFQLYHDALYLSSA